MRSGAFGLPDDGAWQHSYTGLPTTVSEVGGVPVRAFGRMFVYGQSPTFQTGILLQQGTHTPQTKITPKRSWEITDNYVGSMVSYQPHIPQNDFQAYLAVNLQDGDPHTAWCSRGDGQADVTPSWVRLDLAAQEKLTEIVLVARQDKLPWPKQLTVKLSTDGWHWTTVYDSKTAGVPADGEPVRVHLPQPTPAKQIWVIGEDAPGPGGSRWRLHLLVCPIAGHQRQGRGCGAYQPRGRDYRFLDLLWLWWGLAL